VTLGFVLCTEEYSLTWALDVTDDATSGVVHELNADLGDTSTGTYKKLQVSKLYQIIPPLCDVVRRVPPLEAQACQAPLKRVRHYSTSLKICSLLLLFISFLCVHLLLRLPCLCPCPSLNCVWIMVLRGSVTALKHTSPAENTGDLNELYGDLCGIHIEMCFVGGL